ncbi:MAG: hypothetical protein SOX20_00845 [Parolsenella sp.]|uniref:hypothetical protein n=1 Tax=Parolsenella sp. TaxID=2083006 RepID=UPI002A765761|nr:hypothetical protein [Parolsenella sp.]MCI5949685.1 hypothetical protein [Coriobacteriaceae bacterium]MDY3291470.1 hypothetical protein [Parolsenella sp.]
MSSDNAMMPATDGAVHQSLPGRTIARKVARLPERSSAFNDGDRWRRVGDGLARLGLALCALMLGVVLLVVVLSTVWLMVGAEDGNLTQSMSIYTWAGPKASLIAGAVGGVVTAALCYVAWRHGSVLDGPRATRALVLGALVFQVLMILGIQARDTYWGDSWMIRDFVHKAIEGGGVAAAFSGPYGTLFTDARLYFCCYPFQASLFWIMYALRLAFGEYSYMVFQLLSSLATCLGVWALLDLGSNVGVSAGARRILWVLVAMCLPMYWLSAFLYGNAMGCGFALAFLALQARAMRADELRVAFRWLALSFVPLVLALCVKATFVLFAIAAVLAWLVLAVSRKSAWGLAACLSVVLLARSAAGLPFEALRAASGYEFGDALTTLNHLELGLRMGAGEFYVSVDGGAPEFAPGGWSNHANATWFFSGESADIQNEIAAGEIAADVTEFVSDPSYAARFFSVKLATEWADPTYQSLYYLSMCGIPGGGRLNLGDASKPLGAISSWLTYLLDGYQTVEFAAAFGYVAWACRRWGRGSEGKEVAGVPAADPAGGVGSSAGARRHDVAPTPDVCVGGGSVTCATLLIAATFFTGFGCYLLWEAKAVYVLPFAIVVLPLAAEGLEQALQWAKSAIGGERSI